MYKTWLYIFLRTSLPSASTQTQFPFIFHSSRIYPNISYTKRYPLLIDKEKIIPIRILSTVRDARTLVCVCIYVCVMNHAMTCFFLAFSKILNSRRMDFFLQGVKQFFVFVFAIQPFSTCSLKSKRGETREPK